MELWLIILISAVGGLLLIVLITTIICCVCCRRRRRRRKVRRVHKGQNGNAWQAHDHVVEVSDDENSPKLDGLCKDTISGSTFPRLKKEQHADDHKEDGLCADTKSRSMQRRGKLEGAFLAPGIKPRSASESALESVLPLGGIVATIGSNDKIDNHQNTEVVQIEHGFRKEFLPNGTIQNDNEHEKRKDSEGSSSSSEESSSFNHLKTSVYRKRSKSFEMESVPEYTKPVKRAASNPCIDARESVIKKNESFKHFNASMPLPEPDYPLARYPPSPKNEHTDHVRTSSMHSQSGVVNIVVDDSPSTSNVPESPEMPSRPPSFLAEELRTSSAYGGQTVSYTTTEKRSFSDGENVTIITDYEKNETSNVPAPPPLPQEKDSSWRTSSSSNTEQTSEVSDLPAPPPPLPQGAFTYQEKDSNWKTPGSSYTEQRGEASDMPAPPPPPPPPQGTFSTTFQENGHNWKTSGFTYTEQKSETNHHPAPPPLPQGAFTTTFQEKENVKTASPKFSKIDTSYKPITNVATEKKQTSSWTSNEQPAVDFRRIKLNPTSKRINDDHDQAITSQKDKPEHTYDSSRVMPSTLMSERHEYKTASPVIGHGQTKVSMSHNTPQLTTHTTTKTTHHSTTNGPSYINNQTEHTKKIYELHGNGVKAGGTSVTTNRLQTQSTTYKTTERHQPEADSHSQPDFRGFKLRPTPENIKQHIGFRQDLNPGQQEKTPDVTTQTDKKLHEVHSNGDVTIPASDYKTYGFHSQLRNGHIPQKRYESPSHDTNRQQSQKTYGLQHTNTQDSSMKVFSIPGQTSNVTRSESTSKKTASMNGTVKNHSSPGLVIERIGNDKPVPGKAVPAANEPVIMRPKKTENIPDNTAAQTGEDRKRNWKREQMEQRLSTTLVMNERQPIMQASGLALKSVLPELFNKIKQIGDQDEESPIVTVAT